jgi:hypothetical protein
MMDVKMDFDPDHLTDMVLQEGLAAAKERAQFLRCQTHGEAPELKLDGANITVSACCQKFAEEVGEAIAD